IKKHPSAGIKPSGQVPLSCYEFFSTEKGALFEIWRIKKGTVLFKEAYGFESCQFLKKPFSDLSFFS
ncbi:MAG: hypothetical protein MRZ28_10590, partial [Oscillospiraceae bacterium]|nr:hypothetical protein [Oscillospiraceae bacterium]